jgi:long-chain acyl-CoA synthetase
MSFNLATILRESRNSTPDRPLAYFGDRPFTFAEVDESSGRVAASLLGLGLKPDDKIALQLPNSPQFVDAYFGALKTGLVVCPLNPLLRAPEIAFCLDNSDAKMLVTYSMFAEEALKAASAVGGLPTYVVDAPGSQGRPEGVHRFAELYGCADTGEMVPTNADDTAVLLYTSGTTGRPKGAELTHCGMYMSCTVGGDTFGFGPHDIALGALPFFHVFGLSSMLNVGVRYGVPSVYLPRFEAQAVLDAIERYHCTSMAGVPTMFFELLRTDTTGRDVSSLRRCVSGGDSIPGEIIRAFEEKFPNVVILEGYGLSETVATATLNTSAEERKVRSIGRPVWGIEVRIVDTDEQPLPPGEESIGEIVVRGHCVTKGYYKDPQTTGEAFRGGWFHTGDLAYADEDGYLFIVDRKKDLIIRGGFNVYPREIEDVLYGHPAIAEVAVIGRPDKRLGEEIVAVVAFKPDTEVEPDELIAYCKERVAPYKYPREVRILDELPKGPTGKILKKELRLD